jgi:RNA polymerase sigma-70 factor (ECF subfamily)
MEKAGAINTPLIEKCRQNDRKAQFRVFQQYSTAMYNIAMRFLNNKMDAEDIIQESFVTAFLKLNELKESRHFGGWLKRIVINNCLSSLRKKQHYFEDLKTDVLSDENEDEENTVDHINPAVLHEAIKELPSGGRTILALYALEGYKHREIAEMLSISESTSRTQYRRALSMLQKKLTKQIV